MNRRSTSRTIQRLTMAGGGRGRPRELGFVVTAVADVASTAASATDDNDDRVTHSVAQSVIQ